MGKEKPRFQNLVIRNVRTDVKEKLQQTAKRQGKTLSGFLRPIIKDHISPDVDMIKNPDLED